MAQSTTAHASRTRTDHTPDARSSRDGSSSAPSAPTRLFLTSDVRAAIGLSRTHMDFYIREGLVVPTARTESGFLLFDESEVALLREVIAERQAGVPLKDIRNRVGR
jgi:hypothetical protein